MNERKWNETDLSQKMKQTILWSNELSNIYEESNQNEII